MKDSFSLFELEALFGHSQSDQIRLRMTLAPDHAERLKQVEAALNWIAQEHVKTRQHRQGRSEDALSIDIVTDLKAMGFSAGHDTQYGGHCDIVVEGKDGFLWLAEAKIHSAYDWLLKGFQQLDTRYSTGLAGQENGEMIIYSFGQRSDLVLGSWVDHLKAARPDVVFDDAGDDKLERRSSHTHQGTGRKFRVRHKIIPLYFKPQDSAAAGMPSAT